VAGEKPRLRKREILLAVAAGALATGTAAIVMEGGFDVVEYSEPSAANAIANGPASMEYALADFTEIFSNGPQDVVVTHGEEFSVRSEGSAGALGTLQARVEDGRLTIAPPEGFDMDNWRRLQDATFYVTLPSLSAVALTGYGDMTIDRVEGDKFSAAITGRESELVISGMEVDEAEIAIAGSGEITLSGVARETTIFIGGSGEINAAGLSSERADITIGGTGDVSLSVSDDANIAIGGRGNVDIYGNATCSVAQIGGGDVDCGLAPLPGMDNAAGGDVTEPDAAVEEEG
jgi:hypothetical protein